jgi:Tfp pilus assembly protein PilF
LQVNEGQIAIRDEPLAATALRKRYVKRSIAFHADRAVGRLQVAQHHIGQRGKGDAAVVCGRRKRVGADAQRVGQVGDRIIQRGRIRLRLVADPEASPP